MKECDEKSALGVIIILLDSGAPSPLQHDVIKPTTGIYPYAMTGFIISEVVAAMSVNTNNTIGISLHAYGTVICLMRGRS